MILKPVLLFALLCSWLAIPRSLFSQVRPVEAYGQLYVDGMYLRDQCDRFAQLKGPSFFWSQWEGKEHWNEEVVEWLASDWKAEVVRASMGVRPGDCCDYFGQTEATVNQLRRVIDGAIASGIYVIIDWHAHGMHTAEAKAFFSNMARIYGHYPNVLYEIYNEPTGDSWSDLHQDWSDLKEYSRILIAAIREHDPDNIILCPTPFYDQFVHHAADDPITVDIYGNPVKNIAYTLHVYAGSHRFDGMEGSWAKEAVSKGLPLFVTECAPVGTDFSKPRATSINAPDYDEWLKWQRWWDEHHISYTTWSLSTKDEYSAALLPGAPVNGNWDYHTHLSEEGQWYRDHFRAENAMMPCEGIHLSQDSLVFRATPDHQAITLFTLHPVKLGPTRDWVHAILSPNSTNLQISVAENTGGFRADTLLIRALAEDSLTTELYISQWPFIEVGSLRIPEDTIVLGLHQQLPVTVEIFPTNADNDSLIWSFADTTVAGSEPGNIIRSISEGQTMVYAASEDNGIMDSVLLQVESCVWDVNLAYSRPAQASSMTPAFGNSAFGPESAVDGDPDTHWISDTDDHPWYVLDLEHVFFIDRIRISWKEACSEGYVLQVSEDSITWHDMAFGSGGSAGTHDFNNIQMWASYVRIRGEHRDNFRGISITELQIYGCSRFGGAYLQVSPPKYTGSHRDTLAIFRIFSNTEYSISASGDWLNPQHDFGNGDGTLACNFSPNTGEVRSDTLFIVAGEITRTIVITQEQGPAGITANPGVIYCTANDTVLKITISTTSSYTIRSNQYWARPTTYSGFGNGICTVRISSNDTGMDRTAAIEIRDAYSAATVLIHQEAEQLTTGGTISEQMVMQVFPNPVRDQIGIRFGLRKPGELLKKGKLRLRLLDADGRTVVDDSRYWHPEGVAEYHMDLSKSGALPPAGLYFLEIRYESNRSSGVLHRKVVIR